MGTDVTDSVHPIVVESGSRSVLLSALQPLLTSTLTLVLLAGEVAEGASVDSPGGMKESLDALEQVALACVRRTDVVLRCGDGCCAIVLLGVEVEGALRVVSRLRQRLAICESRVGPLWVGLASAPEQALTGDALIALASSPRLRLADEAHAPCDGVDVAPLPEVLPIFPGSARRSSRGVAHLPEPAYLLAGERSPGSHEERKRPAKQHPALRAPDTFVQARARALGVPYLAPPQQIPSSVRNLLPPDVMRQLRCLPIGRDRNSLTVALADPTDSHVLRRLEQMTGLTIFPVMTDPDVLAALARPVRARRSGPLSAASAGRGRN